MIGSGFQINNSRQFWDKLSTSSMDGTNGLWAVPSVHIEKGAVTYYLLGVTLPRYKRFRLYIVESNCLILGEDDETLNEVKKVIKNVELYTML